MKKIAVGDLGEFWYGDYKEPFVQLEGAVPGYPKGALLYDDDLKPMCAKCGGTFDNLGNHARIVHGLPAREYKAEVGLLQKSALVSERERNRRVATTLRRVAEGKLVPFPKGHAGHRGKILGPRLIDGRRSPEKLNMTGRCYEQVLAVGRSILAERGRVTSVELRRRGVEGAVFTYFDSVDSFARAIGSQGRTPRGKWQRANLVQALRETAMKLGRTPGRSDLRRLGLPSHHTFERRFGSYVEACRTAGLQPNLPRGVDGDAAVLVAYATIGDIRKVSTATRRDTATVRSILDRYGVPVFFGFAKQAERADARQFAGEIARRLSGWSEEAIA